jgi:hypothetical protein
VSQQEEHTVSEPEIVKEPEDISALFVQSAHGAEHVDGRIVLRSVSPSTLYFSDRPQRVVGHLHTAEFVGFWDEGEDSFKEDPPNAVLAFVATGAQSPQDVVVTIDDPVLTGSDLSYAATLLDGTLPTRTGVCTLFIDPFGRPLSPVSVAGMNRRDRRRDRR